MLEKIRQQSQHWILRPRIKVVFETVIYEKNSSSSISSFQQEKQTFGEIIWVGFVKTTTHMSGRMFSGNVKIFLGKTTNLKFFLTFSENFSVRWQVFFGRVVKTRFWVSRITFGGIISFLKKISHLLWTFCERFLKKFQNCFLCVQSKFLRRVSVKVRFFHLLITLSQEKNHWVQFL